MYPQLEIRLSGIAENAQRVDALCKQNGIMLSLVTKLLSGNQEIVEALTGCGIHCICDSRIQNLISYQDIPAEKWLTRIPMLSEADDIVRYADASLNSELVSIRALNEAARKQGKVHKVILMYELGDIREGCSVSELEAIIPECLQLRNIELYGIGTNIGCYGEIVPTPENMREFEQVVTHLEAMFNIKFQIVSGGATSSFDMLKKGELPKVINNLRIGEAVFSGYNTNFLEYIPELIHDNFVLKAEIIELKEKPSVPRGQPGRANAFGEKAKWIDRGMRKKAIIGIGRQDVRTEGLFPFDEQILVLHGSSDHIILDVTDSKQEYHVGDILAFRMNYSSTLTALTSKYVEKKII